jgi:tetratricopeptide (TPR) repeat protein
MVIRYIELYGYQIAEQGYLLLGEWEKAQQLLETALRYVTPNFRQYVLSDLVEAYERLGLVDEAVRTLEELIPLLSPDRRAYHEERLIRFKRIG